MSKRKNIIRRGLSLIPMAAMLTSAAWAGDLASSTLVTGTRKLIGDVTTVLVSLSLVIGGGAFIYFMIRKSMADEADGKTWQKRAVTAVICGLLGALGSGIIGLVAGYYGVS